MWKKIICPCYCDVGGPIQVPAFCKIEYADNGRLSISGVVGPTRGGNCRGSCGQCVDEVRTGRPNITGGWTAEMLSVFCDIWENWHLNDMRPYCSHQKGLGWDKLASWEVTLYNYELTREAAKKQREAKDAALEALRKGETFTPTAEQTRYASLPTSITVHTPLPDSDLVDYQPTKPWRLGDKGPTTKKTLGWLKPDEHPDGLLGKPCPVCGYRYGSAWKKEEVPKELIDWLRALPGPGVIPAWV